MSINNFDLEKAKKIVIEWAKEKPYIKKIYFFGSRITGVSKKTGEQVTAESDFDVAVEFDKFPGDENLLATWCHEGEKWQQELANLLGWDDKEDLHLEWHHPEQTPGMANFLDEESIVVYSVD